MQFCGIRKEYIAFGFAWCMHAIYCVFIPQNCMLNCSPVTVDIVLYCIIIESINIDRHQGVCGLQYLGWNSQTVRMEIEAVGVKIELGC